MREFEDHQDRTGELVILMGQSIVLGEVKAEAPLHDEDPTNNQIIWQQYCERSSCEFLVRSAFLSLVWHMHGVCLLHGHVAHSSHYG